MELICFPSADPLRDLVLPLHVKPRSARLLITPQCKESGGRLAQCLRDRGFDVQSLDWPAFEDCSDHAGQVMTQLGPLLESAAEREMILALGQSAGAWELVCQQVLRELLREGEFRVIALTQDAGRAVHLQPGPVALEKLESFLEPADYLSACNATLRTSASDEALQVEAMRSRRALTFEVARHCADLGPALGTLNYLSHRALDDAGERLVDPKQALPFEAASPLRRALAGMVDAGLLDFDGERELIF